MAEFNVCPQGHPLPIWWAVDFCLKCDYTGGMEKLKIISEAINPGSFPEYRSELSPQDVPTPVVPTGNVPTCEDCGTRPREGRYRVCSACRKAAYRKERR